MKCQQGHVCHVMPCHVTFVLVVGGAENFVDGEGEQGKEDKVKIVENCEETTCNVLPSSWVFGLYDVIRAEFVEQSAQSQIGTVVGCAVVVLSLLLCCC